MLRFVEVAKKSQIPENSVIGVEVEGKILALVNLNGEIYALDDTFPHEAGPLSEGAIEGEEIVCPLSSAKTRSAGSEVAVCCNSGMITGC